MVAYLRRVCYIYVICTDKQFAGFVAQVQKGLIRQVKRIRAAEVDTHTDVPPPMASSCHNHKSSSSVNSSDGVHSSGVHSSGGHSTHFNISSRERESTESAGTATALLWAVLGSLRSCLHTNRT